MADNYLITGYHGEPHVTAENDRGIQAGIVGAGRFVLPVGNQFRCDYVGNNTIRMYDGKLLDNGAAAGIPAGEYLDFPIANAGQGMQRNDLIVFQYSRDISTMVETGAFIVIQGVEGSTATDPALTQEDLLSGDATLDQMVLYRVHVSGVTINTPEQLFAVSEPISDLAKDDHVHGAITNDGKIGTTTGRIITTGTGGALEASTPAAARTKLGLHAVAASGSFTDLNNKPTIDSTVTASGSNAVNGAAVAAYALAKSALVLTTTDPGADVTTTYPDGTVILVYE